MKITITRTVHGLTHQRRGDYQLLTEVMSSITSSADKMMVHNTLIALIEADGKPPEEEQFIEMVEQALAGKKTNPITQIGGFFKKSFSFRSQDVQKRKAFSRLQETQSTTKFITMTITTISL